MRRSSCLRPRIRAGSDSRGHRGGGAVVGGHLLGDFANQVGAVAGPGVVRRDDHRSLLETGGLQLLKGGGVRSTVSNGTPSLVSWRLVASHCGQCGLVNTVTVMATPLDVVLMNSEAKAILQRCDLKSRHYM